MRLLILLLLLTAGGIAAADNYHAIVENAFESLDNGFKEDWSFTETSNEDDTVIVGHYDPRRGNGERWVLVSVDGRQPSSDEIADYKDRKNSEEAANNDEQQDESSEGNTVDFTTLDLLEETDDFWIFSFIPQGGEDADDEEAHILRQVAGQLKIVKEGHYVEYIDLRNDNPIKPAKGVKISRFETRLGFGPAAAGGPIVPLSVDVAVKGRAMLFIKLDETQSIRYSDYEYVGTADIGAG